ncbi:DUF2142 domain-containing protein [Microseira sp. BLCC-F43]|uniref:DUF2142 domain-containing protein n=1 Tax=Microseira sp. BLCC-F43 TaxID=3153602 RepID=UPI0035BB17CB
MEKTGFILKKPENLFLALALTFGILFTLIIAAFHAESEPQHYYRSYQISEVKLIADKKIVDCYGQQFETYLPSTTCVGGMLPKSLLTTAKITEGIASRKNPKRKQNIKTIIGLLNLPLDSNNRVFLRFPNISLFFPITHLPQAFGMAIGRLFNVSPLVLLYVGRICNLLVWVLLVYLAIKIIPFYKWLLILLAFTPMSIFQASSLSGDALTNGLSFLLISVILTTAFAGEKAITKYEIFILALLSLLLSLCKLAYCPILFLLWVIPVPRFRSKKQYFLTLSVIILFSLAAVLSWLVLTRDLNVPLRLDTPNLTTEQRLNYLASQPGKLLVLLGNTLRVHGLTYLEQYLGGMGWGETKMPIWHIVSYGFVLVSVALCSHEKDIVVSVRQKAISLSIAVTNIALIFTLLYITWNDLDSDVIQGFQARYFIPISPLLFLLLYNQKIKLNFKKCEYALAYYLLFCQTLTLAVLLKRYWL